MRSGFAKNAISDINKIVVSILKCASDLLKTVRMHLELTVVGGLRRNTTQRLLNCPRMVTAVYHVYVSIAAALVKIQVSVCWLAVVNIRSNRSSIRPIEQLKAISLNFKLQTVFSSKFR